MNKILHISHSQDLDGKVAPMLTKLLYGNHEVEILLLSNADMNNGIITKMKSIIDEIASGSPMPYEKIIITDLGIDTETFDFIALLQPSIPIQFYDHHIDSIKNATRYNNIDSWIHVDDAVSATFIYGIDMATQLKPLSVSLSAYYEILKNVSDYDTFKFKDNGNIDAERLNILLNIVGDSKFEKNLIDYMIGESCSMGSERDLAIVNYIIDNRQNFIDHIEMTAKVVSIHGRKCVISFTDQINYVSELGYQICKKHPEIDLFMVINPDNANVQLRARKESANLYEFAQAFGGGGHKFSAGFPFSMDIYNTILREWKKSNEYLMSR